MELIEGGGKYSLTERRSQTEAEIGTGKHPLPASQHLSQNTSPHEVRKHLVTTPRVPKHKQTRESPRGIGKRSTRYKSTGYVHDRKGKIEVRKRNV